MPIMPDEEKPAASRDGLFSLHATGFELCCFQAVLANIVRTPPAMLMATTCDELRPWALSADAASGVASMDFRSDCMSSWLVRATTSSTFERISGFRSLTLTICTLCISLLGWAAGVCACDCGGVPCVCASTKAGAPRTRVAAMADAVKIRMVIPFRFENQEKLYPRNLVGV